MIKRTLYIFVSQFLFNNYAQCEENQPYQKAEFTFYDPSRPEYIQNQYLGVRDYWNDTSVDLYPDEKDYSKKPLYIDGVDYDNLVVSNATSKFLINRPWFLTFINSHQPDCNLISKSLQHLAHYYQGDIQFAYTSSIIEENLAFSFDVTNSWQLPVSFFIDKDGIAYIFDPVLPGINSTINWIDNKLYKTSPISFKAPARWSDLKLKWGYVKNWVRGQYKTHLRQKVESLLRSVHLTYLVDMDPVDFRNAKSTQKLDRQIIILLGLVGMILESIYDFIAERTCPQKPQKKKSIMSSSKNDVKDEQKTQTDGKQKREKIE